MRGSTLDVRIYRRHILTTKVDPRAVRVDVFQPFNPLGPHDALKHHFTSLKTYLIFLQLGVLE